MKESKGLGGLKRGRHRASPFFINSLWKQKKLSISKINKEAGAPNGAGVENGKNSKNAREVLDR